MNSVRHPIPELAQRLESELRALSTRREKTFLAARTMFFDWDVYPSAQTVLSYTQQGSITDINRDLRAFWTDLREKGRSKFALPIFPPELSERLAHNLSDIWELAISQASDALSEERQQLNDQRQATKVEMEKAQALVAHVQKELDDARTAIDTAKSRAEQAVIQRQLIELERDTLIQQVAALNAKLGETVDAARVQQDALEVKLAQSMAEHARTQEVMEGQIKFATMQIEHARGTERDLRALVEKERIDAGRQLAEYRIGRNEAEAKLHATLLKNAELSGRLKALTGEERGSPRKRPHAKGALRNRRMATR